MKEWMKRWLWSDWVMLCIRISWWITLVISLCILHERGLPIPLWAAMGLSFVPLFVPLWLQQYHLQWYLIAEMVLSGSFVIFLNLYGISNVWQYAPIVFVIGFLSSNSTYRWTAILSSGVIPFILGW